MKERKGSLFVTGAGTDGIGQGVVREAVLHGGFKKVVLHYARSLDQGFMKWLSDHGVEAAAIQADFANPASMADLALKAYEQLGPIQVLVNVAGITYTTPFMEASVANWEEAFRVNAISPLQLTRHVVPLMVGAEDNPNIVFISTNHVLFASKGHTLYAASKAAVDVCFRNVGLLLVRKHGIRVNLVRPGWVKTRRHVQAHDAGEYSLDSAAKGNPTGRIALPDEVGMAVLGFVDNPSFHCAEVDLDNGARVQFPGSVEADD